MTLLKRLKNISFGKPGQILVCETDGLVFRGAVIARDGGRLKLLHSCQSEQLDPALALADVINTLKNAGWTGNKAVLLSPAAISSLIELPINPKKPKPITQMQALIRWEAEPLLMQQQNQWTLGYLLVKQGAMTLEQVQHIRELQQQKPAGAGIGVQQRSSLQRFGDLAIEQGYLDKDRLAATLQCQSWLRAEDEEIECSWQPQAAVTEAPGIYHWLISGIYRSVLTRWTDAFKRHGITLMEVFPLASAATGLLTRQQESETETTLLEFLGSAVAISRFDAAGNLYQLQHFPPHHEDAYAACLEAYHGLSGETPEVLCLSSVAAQAETLAEQLEVATGRKVTLLPTAISSLDASPSMQGAAARVTGVFTGKGCLAVRVGGPQPPVWQRQEMQIAALVAGILLIIVAAETTLMLRESAITTQKQALDERAKTLDEAVRRITAINEQIEARKNLLKEQQANQQRMESRMAFFGEELPERNLLLQAILGMLQNALNDHIVINSIDEMGKRLPMMGSNEPVQNDVIELDHFNIDAWSLTEGAAQEFIQSLKDAATTWNLIVRDVQILERPGPLSLDGYTVVLSLVKIAPRPLQISEASTKP